VLALAIVIFTVVGNSMAVGKPPKGIVSEAAYAALALAVAQARSSLIDFIVVWEKLAILKKRKKSSITIDGGLASSGANRDGKNGNKYVIDGEEDGKEKKACETKARSKNNEIKE
jgi:hypothetical protein